MTFDYIIVGSGPAGCFLAKALSDNDKNSVLLLESGENNNNDPLIKISTNETKLYNYYPQFFWQGVTKAYPTLNDRHFTWSTGRLLGGGSSVNGEQYVRPTPAVLEQWEPRKCCNSLLIRGCYDYRWSWCKQKKPKGII